MILLNLTPAMLLLTALVRAAPSFQNQNQLHSKLHNMTEIETKKSSNLTTRGQDYSDEEADAAITYFLNRAMLSYSLWLAQEDPLQPDPTEVTLITSGFDFPDMDAELKIRNQYLANHSLALRFYDPSSNFPIRFIHVIGAFLAGQPVTFGGDYTVNGTLKVSDTLDLPFSGQGRYILKGREFLEAITYRDYTINDDGYIEIASISSIEYVYFMPKWDEMVFEGLKFNYDGEVDASWTNKLEDTLGEMYKYLLVDFYEEFTWNNLPKRLLHTYLTQQFLTTTLEDMISAWRHQLTNK